MSKAVPTEIRDGIRQKIWDKANELGWQRLAAVERTAWYENWSKDKEIGGALSHFMDPRKVRVYIKDSLLKPYLRKLLQHDGEKAFLIVGLNVLPAGIRTTYDKPHGRLLADGKVICWGNSRDWKTILLSVFERSYRVGSAIPYAAVLVETGHTKEDGLRQMIMEVGERLKLGRVVWTDS